LVVGWAAVGGERGVVRAAVGDIAAMPVPGGGFGACQVAGVDERTVRV
jgi:hypothetical protein